MEVKEPVQPQEFETDAEYEESFEGGEPDMEEEPLGPGEFDENSPTEFGPECFKRIVRRAINERRRKILKEARVTKPAGTLDQYSFLPIKIYEGVDDDGKPMLNEAIAKKVKHSHWHDRCSGVWESKYGTCTVIERTEEEQIAWDLEQEAAASE